MRRRRGPGLLGRAVVVSSAARMGAASAHRQQAAAHQAAAPAQPAPEPAPDDAVAQIEKFAALRSQGLITEEEFSAKKKQILGI